MDNLDIKHQILIRLFFTLVFISITAAAYVLLPEKTPNNQISQSKPQITDKKNDITTNTVISAPKKFSSPSTLITNDPTVKDNTVSTTTIQGIPEINTSIPVTFKIEGQTYNLNLPENSTVYDALQQLINNKQITAVMKKFSGMGYFVEEINGIKNNNQTEKYWVYYINGQSAPIGISSYILKSDDLITWKYAKDQF